EAEPLTAIARQPVHTWEPFLLAAGLDQSEAIMAKIGMVPPPSTGSRRDYFRANFAQTIKHLSTGGQLLPPDKWPTKNLANWLAQFSDHALFQMSGAYVSYSSRDTLINALVAAHVQPTFFVSLQKKCRNTETISGEKTAE